MNYLSTDIGHAELKDEPFVDISFNNMRFRVQPHLGKECTSEQLYKMLDTVFYKIDLKHYSFCSRCKRHFDNHAAFEEHLYISETLNGNCKEVNVALLGRSFFGRSVFCIPSFVLSFLEKLYTTLNKTVLFWTTFVQSLIFQPVGPMTQMQKKGLRVKRRT